MLYKCAYAFNFCSSHCIHCFYIFLNVVQYVRLCEFKPHTSHLYTHISKLFKIILWRERIEKGRFIRAGQNIFKISYVKYQILKKK